MTAAEYDMMNPRSQDFHTTILEGGTWMDEAFKLINVKANAPYFQLMLTYSNSSISQTNENKEKRNLLVEKQ